MAKAEIAAFFDVLAPGWDAHARVDGAKIERILDWAGVEKGMRVLDAACGTGILVPFLLERNVAAVVGVDIAPAMIACAREKCRDRRVRFMEADAETAVFAEGFDAALVFNAFPHFLEPAALLGALAAALRPGGRLAVAHDRGRAQVNAHHAGMREGLRCDLLEAEALAGLFAPYFDVDVCVSQADIYAVAGRKR